MNETGMNGTVLALVLKATLAVAFGLALVWLARRSRAALRHAILAATFAVLVALPIVSVIEQPVRIFVPVLIKAVAPLPVAAAKSAAPVKSTPKLPGSRIMVATWLAGTVFSLLPLLAGLRKVRILRASSTPWPESQPIVDELAANAGIRRPVPLLLHDELAGPMTCGVLRPAIVLPREAQTWQPDDLHRAIVHELEHIRRGDRAVHCMARAVCALYWFHPLVWIAWQRLTLEAERSCDDAVLAHFEPTAYADQLVDLARRLSQTAKPPLLAMASRADLKKRVSALLNPRQRRGRLGRSGLLIAGSTAAGLLIAMWPISLIAAPQTPPDAVAEFHTYSGLATVNVSVKDTNGKSIDGLGARDFILTEDGVPQTISVFEFQKAPDATGPVSSYYTFGYYTTNRSADGLRRRIKVIRNNDPAAKIEFRSVSTPEPLTPPVADANTTLPIPIYRVDPEYSETARKAKYQADVVLSVGVDTSGRVVAVNVVKSAGLGLDEKAIQAARQWKFKPGTKDGKPIEMQARIDMTFRLL
jgi:TonB family protein